MQDLSSGECSDPHDDLWGWSDCYPIVHSKELRLGDGGTCPASEWEGLAGKASSDRLQGVRWEARCFLLVFLMWGPFWAGERGCWVCPLPAGPSALSQGTPCFLLGEAWKILFCLLSFLDLVLNVILPEPTASNSPELGTQDPPTFPRPLHPPDPILRLRTRWRMRPCFLVFPGWWFLVNILQMKGLIKVQAVHFICLTLYTLFRGFWDHLSSEASKTETNLQGLKTRGPLSYLVSDAQIFLSEKLFLSPYVKVERVCIKNPGLRLLLKNRNCWHTELNLSGVSLPLRKPQASLQLCSFTFTWAAGAWAQALTLVF